jgi:hypothetical protein
MHDSGNFTSLRLALLTALGMGVAVCDGSVEIETEPGVDPTCDTSSTKSSGSGGGGAGGAIGAPPGAVCEDAEAILAADGSYSGFARCPDETIHRTEAVACSPALCVKACDGSEERRGNCETDADCTLTPYGKCRSTQASCNAAGTYCDCAYSCATDADCGAGNICLCAGTFKISERWSVCVPAGCATGDDCASGECGASTYDITTDGLACRNATDPCGAHAQCDEGECLPSEDRSGWECVPTFVCGRPLLVEGQARTSPTKSRRDWARGGARPDVNGLDPALREALAAHWRGMAALEHASVASFARFTLQLLALGAPPDLLADAQRAAADEVEHARAAYAIASAYAGRALGPAALDLGGVPIAVELREVLRGLIEEACVGETLGVAEAVTVAEAVADPVLREVHARIAEEELRHAALGWRALQWALSQADAETRRFVAEVFERATAAATRAPEPREHVAREHGLLSAEEIGALRRRAIRDVVLPCARALVGAAHRE